LDALDETLSRKRSVGFWRWRTNWWPTGCEKLRGYKDQWRIRAGDWRVLYIIDDAAKLIRIMRIATPKPGHE
jgi:hypothetical protein